ncbi:hypothetical protein KHA80_02920 [Anaerobacillus sp. HL2]|nr:hypothetical protein KHA80_02920 [Anaerobacillus sp. HL2]
MVVDVNQLLINEVVIIIFQVNFITVMRSNKYVVKKEKKKRLVDINIVLKIKTSKILLLLKWMDCFTMVRGAIVINVKHLFLTGLMGAENNYRKIVSKRLNMPVLDTDEYVETKQNKKIKKYFPKMEKQPF